MSFPLLPTIVANAVTDLTPRILKEHSIELLMLDFDNTIVPYTTSVPSDRMLTWLHGMQRSGIHLCVVSNSRNQRVVEFCKKYDLDYITHAQKPFVKGIRQCLERYQVRPERCALVGDQIFTDTLGANIAGVKSILVKAINNHNVWLKLRHVAEKPFIIAAKNRRMKL